MARPKNKKSQLRSRKVENIGFEKDKIKVQEKTLKNFDRFVEYIFFAETDLKTSFLKLIKELILKQQRKKHAH
jgi:hypothetical protein